MAAFTIYEDGSNGCKTLDPSIATSILCHSGILYSDKKLICLGSNKENEVFRVNDTNICIMHVECSFCILVDYIVDGIYIPGDRWLLYQALTGYPFMTGLTPDLKAMEAALKG